jgi:hypothetical protein
MRFFSLLIVVTFIPVSGCSLFPQEEATVPVVICPEPEPVVCPAPQVIEKLVIKTVPAELPPMATTAGKLHLPIIGAVEWARVEPSGLLVEARIDTGAETTSIHAEDIRRVERDGESYISFTLEDPATGEVHSLERRLQRQARIKQHGADSVSRYVVYLWVTLGNNSARVQVTLSDRKDFEYPLLLGRNFLTDAMIVDVSLHHLLDKPGTSR